MAIHKKRKAPDPVKPVSKAGIRYEALVWGRERDLGQNGGYIIAFDENSGDELWILKIYNVDYDNDMEQDKQDVFITKLSLSWISNQLKVKNERGEQYRVDLKTREVTQK
ncbi:hypothetical protein [Motiliproteus sp. MSK22-1]|uniref:hypothetical protein n=1 Tax=Motiliproteus sp. MSK22-1 TaxID=1897630 RepID=UPI0009788EFF|nr:hypothetical protein [Motiliproteus sp. MSK22-1]OMH26245.1 hypothetical protein BGP75_01035 [Motiliproteus sp. MSK22-1]